MCAKKNRQLPPELPPYDSDDEVDSYTVGVTHPAGLQFRTYCQFMGAAAVLGYDEARNIILGAISKTGVRQHKNSQILKLYDEMKPEPSPWDLACALAKE